MSILVPNPMESLGRGLQTAGSALGGALKEFGAERRKIAEDQRKKDLEIEKRMTQGTQLEKVINDLKIANAGDEIEKDQFFAKGLQEGIDPDILNKALSGRRQKKVENLPNFERGEFKNILVRAGMDEERAQVLGDLHDNGTTGAKTKVIEYGIDELQRMSQRDPREQKLGEAGQEQQQQPEETKEFQYPEVNPFEGLTKKEKVSRQNELRKENAKLATDARSAVKNAKINEGRFKVLERLNESGRLPKGIEQLNVNQSTGNLRVPQLASPEAQQYVKTLNDFLDSIKQSFGARITDFDIIAFMRRLPGLHNTEMGRKVMLKQLQTLEQIAKIGDEALLDTYRHYGIDNINSFKAQDIAESKLEKEGRFKELQKKLVRTADLPRIERESVNALPTDKLAYDQDNNLIWVHEDDEEYYKNKGYEFL